MAGACHGADRTSFPVWRLTPGRSEASFTQTMKKATLWSIAAVAGLVLLGLGYGIGWVTGVTGVGRTVPLEELSERERAFAERMQNVDLVGHFTIENVPGLEEVEGVKFEHYFGWLVMAFAITLTACPAMSVPTGFTDDGRPVGLQMVAPMGREAELLSAAAVFEALTGLKDRVPLDPRVGEPI